MIKSKILTGIQTVGLILFIGVFLTLPEATGFSPEEETIRAAATTKIQKWWQRHQAYQAFFREYEISIPKASDENMKRVRCDIGEMSPVERKIYKLIYNSFTLLHGTTIQKCYNVVEGKTLKSTLYLKREAQGEVKSNTIGQAMNSFVFFTGGVGDHPTANFLVDPDTVCLEGNFPALEKEGQIQNIFVSGHLTSFAKQDSYARVSINGVSFGCDHFTDYRKKYFYKGPKGVLEKEAALKDEIFSGKDTVRGLACEFLLHVRYLKSLQENPDACILKNVLESSDPLKALEKLFEALMPGDDRVEIKVTSSVKIGKNFTLSTKIGTFRSFFGNVDESIESLIKARDFFLWNSFLEENRIQELNDYFKQKEIPWLTHTFHGNNLIKNIFEATPPSLSFLVFSRLNEMDIEDSFKKEALQKGIKRAVEGEELDVLEELFQTNIKSCRLKGFDYLPTPDLPWDGQVHRFFFDDDDIVNIHRAAALGNIPLLEFFVKKGSRAFQVAPFRLAYVASINNQMECLRYLKDQGFSLAERKELNDFVLGMVEHFIKKGNQEGLEILEGMGVSMGVRSKFESFNPLWSPLHYAAQNDQLALARWFIGKGLSPKARTLKGETSHALAEKVGAKETLAFLNREYPLSETEKSVTLFEQCSTKSFNVVSVIFGTQRGAPAFIVGRKRSEMQGDLPLWKFPGGIISSQDINVEEAALREGQEETRLPLLKLYREGRISVKTIYTDSIVAGDQGSEISFVVVEGLNFDEFKPYANDDLDLVKVVTCSEFEDKGGDNFLNRYWHKGEPIRGSNGYVISCASNLMPPDATQKLREFLSYETFGSILMRQALVTGSLEEILKLQSVGISLAENYPVLIAYEKGYMHLLKYFKEQGLCSLSESYNVCKKAIEEKKPEVFELLFDTSFGHYEMADLYKTSVSQDLFKEKMSPILEERGLTNHIFPSLMLNGMSVTQYGIESALVTAARKGDSKMVEQFLERKDVDPDGKVFYKDISFPLGYHHEGGVYFFVESPLLVAILEGHVACVRTLLKKASPNMTSELRRIDDRSSSFLTHPSQQKSLKDQMALMFYFLSPQNKRDYFYWNNIPSLFLAAICGNIDVANLLLTHPDIDKGKKWQTREAEEVSMEEFFQDYRVKELTSSKMKKLYKAHYPSLK